MYVPTHAFCTKGVGRHREQLVSFEMALRNAKIASYNLVQVSSIMPPGCRMLPQERGLDRLQPGQIVHTVLARTATNEPHRLIAASVGFAIPKNKQHFGYLSEHHSFGQTAQQAGNYAEDLAAQMLATIQGVDFEEDTTYDERQAIWKISGRIVKTHNITQTAIGSKNGHWTTVIACVALLP